MNYSKFEHFINFCLLVAIFAFPISECFINNRIPYNLGVSLINLTCLIVTLLFLDFYKFKISNQLKGIVFYFGLSILTLAVSLILASFSGLTLSIDMILGESFLTWDSAWGGSNKAQLLYMLGLSLFLTCFGLITRLAIFRSVSTHTKQ